MYKHSFIFALVFNFSLIFANCTIQMHGDNVVEEEKIAEFTITIENHAKAKVENIIIHNELSPGFEEISYETNSENVVLEWKLLYLKPNQKKVFSYKLKAIKAGSYTSKVSLKIAGQEVERIKFLVKVLEKVKKNYSLRIKLDGNSKGVLTHKQMVFTTIIENISEADIFDIKIVQFLPKEMFYVRANANGVYDKNERIVTWTIARISPGQKIEKELVVKAVGSSPRIINTVQAIYGENKISSEYAIRLIGGPSMYLAAYDIEDPVTLGKKTTYVIIVRNEATSSATNITLKHDLPQEMEFIQANVPVKLIDNKVVFICPILQAGDLFEVKIEFRAIVVHKILRRNLTVLGFGFVDNIVRLQYDEYHKEIIDVERTEIKE